MESTIRENKIEYKYEYQYYIGGGIVTIIQSLKRGDVVAIVVSENVEIYEVY